MESLAVVTRAKGRNWIGTLNNPVTTGEAYLERISQSKGVQYVTGQLERGEEGTPHIQFFVNTTTPQALSFLKKVCGQAHWEVCRNSAASEKYCHKEDTRVEGPWTFGVKPIEKQNKLDVIEMRTARAEQNKLIME